MHAAGITCSQRLGDLLAALDPADEAEAVRCSGRHAVSIPLAALEDIIDASGIAPRIEALLPTGVRHRQLQGPHPAGRDDADPGRPPARAPDPGARRR